MRPCVLKAWGRIDFDGSRMLLSDHLVSNKQSKAHQESHGIKVVSVVVRVVELLQQQLGPHLQ
jgi:hypothetical protein